MADLVSLREFARRKGWNPGYAHKLKTRGRLVLVGDKVDVAASEALLAESADPARSHLSKPTAGQSMPRYQDAAPGAPPLSQNATFNRARTATQVFEAKLRELEYQKQSGSVIALDEASRIAFTAFRALRDAIENVPARIKDQVAAEPDPFHVERIMAAELTSVLQSFDVAAAVSEPDDEDDDT